jgi:hypothetical protein
MGRSVDSDALDAWTLSRIVIVDFPNTFKAPSPLIVYEPSFILVGLGVSTSIFQFQNTVSDFLHIESAMPEVRL